MKVTIITATYNSEKTIRDTLSSVASQSYKNIEHIVIDGLSTDNTLEIVSEYDHVARVESGKDDGIYHAMNKGLALATGDLIAILNSDDFYMDSKVIENVVNAMKEQDTDTCYGNLEYVKFHNTSEVTRLWVSHPYRRENFLRGWMPPHPSFFARKRCYEQYGFFNLTLKSAADYEIMLRFLYKYRLSTVYLPRVLVRMREGGLSNSSIKNRIKANREDLKAWEINDLKPGIFTRYLKPIRKLTQFLKL